MLRVTFTSVNVTETDVDEADNQWELFPICKNMQNMSVFSVSRFIYKDTGNFG